MPRILVLSLAAILLVSGCAVQSPYEPVEIAKAVKAGAVTPLIGKTIRVMWREQAETCPVDREPGQCRIDESTHEQVVALGLNGVSILSSEGDVVEEIAYEAVRSSAEGVRHKSFLLENEYIEVTWTDAFDVQNRSRTVYAVSGETCWVRKPDTLQSSEESRWFRTETLSCQVRSE